MPGMTSVSGKGRRDIEPANCIYETGSDCDKVRVRESAPGWAATVMSPAAGKLQVLGPKGPLLTNRMTELVTYGSVGGVGGNSGPYPANVETTTRSAGKTHSKSKTKLTEHNHEKQTRPFAHQARRTPGAGFDPQSSTLNLRPGHRLHLSRRLDDGTNPANGKYDLTFAVFDGATPVPPFTQVSVTLTNTGVAISNGLFTVVLDFGTGIFSGADRFLEIGVRTNGNGAFATLSPRQKLTPRSEERR